MSLVPQRNSTIVTIVVYDDNQFAPDFTESNYMFIVQNTSPAGTVVGTVVTTDRDKCSQVHTTSLFMLTSNNLNLFQIGTYTGVVTTTMELLRQDGSIHSFIVVAVDTNTTAPLASTTRINIVVVGEYIPVDVSPDDAFPVDLLEQTDNITYVQNFNYFYETIKKSSEITTTFGGLQTVTNLQITDAIPFELHATALTPYIYPDKPVFVLAVQIVDEHGGDSFPPVDIVVRVCNNYGECFHGIGQTADNNVAIVEVSITNTSWFIDDYNTSHTVSVEYGTDLNFSNSNNTIDDVTVLVTTPSVLSFFANGPSGFTFSDEFVLVQLPLRPLYPSECASFKVQVVQPISTLTIQCVVGEGLQFTGTTSGECYSVVSGSVNDNTILVQAARKVATRVPGAPETFLELSCGNSSNEETVVDINVKALADVQPTTISVSCTGVQLIRYGDGEKINGFEQQ